MSENPSTWCCTKISINQNSQIAYKCLKFKICAVKKSTRVPTEFGLRNTFRLLSVYHHIKFKKKSLRWRIDSTLIKSYGGRNSIISTNIINAKVSLFVCLFAFFCLSVVHVLMENYSDIIFGVEVVKSFKNILECFFTC